MPEYLKTLVVIGYEESRPLRLLVLSFVYYFVVRTVLYTEYIHVYNIEAVMACSSLSHKVQSFG